MEYYDTIASGYDELHREEQLKKYRLVMQHFDIGKDDRLLDVGCGTGLFSEVFVCRITGIEPSWEMLREKKTSDNADYAQGQAEHLPFKEEAFDVVVCVTALHNFQKPRKALEEMRRVSKGRGAITIMRKAKKAEELRILVEEMFKIEKVVEEDKDCILFFGTGSS